MTEAGEMEAPVLFEERAAGAGFRIGIATLNSPRTLNGFSLAMTRLLEGQLRRWLDDPTIACVVLQGAGEKAFCAGGDLHGLYKGMLAQRAAAGEAVDVRSDAGVFFAEEYRLDHRIHTSAKPILCWGHGIVMGGGIGLMAGASHRVVTERSKVAFPEITVGLFPDVGGSWLMRQVPRGAGLFLALTGAPLAASDAIYAGLADVCIDGSQREAVIEALCEHAWTGDAKQDGERLSAFLAEMAMPTEPGPLQVHAELIEQIVAAPTLEGVVDGILGLDDQEKWLATAKATLQAGSPGSARLAWELHRHPQTRELADAFRTEFTVGLHVCSHGDFAEGIRALLIDKDRQPKWNPATLAEADEAWAARFFEPIPGPHPLADL